MNTTRTVLHRTHHGRIAFASLLKICSALMLGQACLGMLLYLLLDWHTVVSQIHVIAAATHGLAIALLALALLLPIFTLLNAAALVLLGYPAYWLLTRWKWFSKVGLTSGESNETKPEINGSQPAR